MLEKIDPNCDPAVIKIFAICELLDEELKLRPAVNKKIIATMYYLASLRIKHLFGHKVDRFQVGHKELFALSGLKKPLNELITQYDDCDHDEANKVRLTLVRISNFFDDRFGEITSRPLTQSEYLSPQSQLIKNNSSLNTNHLQDFY